MPTGFGFLFGLVNFVLLMMAIGYANNLIYAFVFLLIAMAVSAMWLTNKNIERVQIEKINVPDLFANEANEMAVLVLKKKPSPSADLVFSFKYPLELSSPPQQMEGAQSIFNVEWRPLSRGVHRLPRLTLKSFYPVGLLQAWRTFEIFEDVVVFPERKGIIHFPQEVAEGAQKEEWGLFLNHRSFQSTDSLRRIDWRASTKHQTLLVKNFEVSENKVLNFDWHHTKHLANFEDRISQLCLWIDLAQKNGLSYSLKIASFHTPARADRDHFIQCLTKLSALSEKDLL